MNSSKARVSRPAAAVTLATVVPAALAAALLAGCAAPGPSRSAASARQQCDALHKDVRLDPLRAHMPVPIVLGQALPIEQLADRGRAATETERDAIKALEGVRAECQRLAEAAIGPLPRYRYDSEDRVSEALADLYAGSLTWGQFNKALLHIGERDRAARENLDEELAAREKWKSFHEFGGN